MELRTIPHNARKGGVVVGVVRRVWAARATKSGASARCTDKALCRGQLAHRALARRLGPEDNTHTHVNPVDGEGGVQGVT